MNARKNDLSVPGTHSMASRWQLIDRPAEFGAIRPALTGNQSCGVFLVGSAGVGKTTLARTVTKSLPAKVHWVGCTESSRSIPLGAFAHLVSPCTSRDPIALMASARESLIAQQNTVIAVDDAYLLDQLSATLLHQIAIDRAGHILATVRSGEPVPDAVTALWKDGYLQRFELEPFTKEETIALIESVIGGTLEGLSADVMWESSGGNALFLRHLVEGAIDAGTLTQVNGVWQLRGATVIPSGLAALLESRLEHAGDVINALKPLALCEPLDIDALTELAGEDCVDAAEVRGLIRIVHDGSQINARFSHPLFGEVVRRRIGTASARKLRGRIARVLRDRRLDSAAGRIRMAQLYIDSDEPVETDLLIAATKDAISLSNLPLGERIARAAVQRGGGLQAAELLSRALYWQGHPVQADAILARFNPDDLDELQLVQWGVPRLSYQFWSLVGDVGEAHQVLALLRERVQHSSLKLMVEAVGSAMAVHENNIDEGLPAAERVLSDPHSPKQAIDFAAFAAGLAMPVVGRGRDFEPIAAKSRAEQKATDGMIRVMVRYGDVLALTHLGELDLADKRAADYAQFTSAGQFLGWALAKIMAGLVAVYRGTFPDAISSIEQALAALAAEASLPWLLPARHLLARAYAALGRVDEADRVLADAQEHTGPHMALHVPQVMIARSWVAATKGMERRAVAVARDAADVAQRSGQRAMEAEALHHAARFGDRTVAERLAALVDKVQGDVAALQACHAAAVAAADAEALDAVSAEFERAGLLLSAADSAAQAAPLHDRAGQRRLSLDSAARALKLATVCGGVVTPAIKAAARPLPVSAREREIALLVAAGLSNKEIAEKLTLSVRTVEGHVYRACFKLDAADRDELAKLMRHEITK